MVETEGEFQGTGGKEAKFGLMGGSHKGEVVVDGGRGRGE